jgi:hypothetical protein
MKRKSETERHLTPKLKVEIKISVNNENEFFFKSIERQNDFEKKNISIKNQFISQKSVVILVH